MNYNFQRPENAITRANVGEVHNAAVALYSIFTSGRHKNWTPTHEVIMKKLLGICFDLRDDNMVKEAITQYRNICQNSNTPSSMLTVINEFIEEIYRKIDKLQNQALPSNDVDSWISFLYETLRNTLESLKNNGPMSSLYHSFCREAFNFCKKFNRPKEFRRLYDLITAHLKLIIQRSNTPSEQAYTEKYRVYWNFSTAEEHLETRFELLEIALDLKCYEVSFMVIQDIHNIMEEMDQKLIKEDSRFSKSNITLQYLKPSLISRYYEKLSQIFWVSKNYLYHAFSRLKYFSLHKSHSKKFNEKKEEVSSIVLLSAICIPLINRNDGNDYQYSSLLNLKETIPTRESLFKEITSIKIHKDAISEFRELYELLEVELHPLTLVKQSLKALEIIKNNEAYSQYETPIKIVILQKILNQLSTIYTTMKIDHFFKLVKDLNLSEFTVERIIIASIKSDHIHVRIDHKNGCLLFNNSDSLESNDMKTQLQVLCNRLESVVSHLYGNNRSYNNNNNNNNSGSSNSNIDISEIRKNLEKEYRDAIERKNLIEKRKQEAENNEMERRRKLEEKMKKEEEERLEKERLRMIEEQRRREIEKKEKMEKEAKLKQAQTAAKRLGKVGPYSANDLDDEKYRKLIEESEEKDRKLMIEIQKRMKDNAKRLDYITRAIRETEAPLISEQIEKDKEEAFKYIKEEYDVYKEKAENYIKNVAIWKEILPIVEPEMGNYEDIIVELRCSEIREELENRKKEYLHAKEVEEERRRQEEEEKRQQELLRREQENKAKNTYVPPSRRGNMENSNSGGGNNSFNSSERRFDRNQGSNLMRNSGPSRGSALSGSSNSSGFSSSSGSGKYVPPSRRR